MKGITFGNFHSWRDFKLILVKKEIGSPTVKENKIDVPGADSSLDLTEFFGEAKYEDVTHKFEFQTIVPQGEFLSLFSTIKNAIHGKKMRVILDDDPLFFWWGRLRVSSFTNDKAVGNVSIEVDCDPYKYKMNETVISRAVNGSANIVLKNGRKRAVPRITTTAAMTIAFDGWSTSRNAGTFIIPELELLEGNNTVAVTGTGTITFTWQEANL